MAEQAVKRHKPEQKQESESESGEESQCDGFSSEDECLWAIENEIFRNHKLVYVVIFTDFRDDYKPRGSTCTSRIFSSKLRADKYILYQLRKRVVSYLSDVFENSSEDEAEYFKSGADLKLNYRAIKEDFEELVERCQEGHYVPKLFDWQTEERSVDVWPFR